MIIILKVAGAFVVAVLLNEILLLSGRKVQSRIFGILMVHYVIFLMTILFITPAEVVRPVSIAIFWLGGFLSWFGIRSHLESSILLRMLYLLKFRSMKPAELLEEYENHYGETLRIEELIRSGLIRRDGQHFTLTRKGRWILAAATSLR